MRRELGYFSQEALDSSVKVSKGGITFRPSPVDPVKYDRYNSRMTLCWQDPAYHGKDAVIYLEAHQDEKKPSGRFYWMGVDMHLSIKDIEDLKHWCELVLEADKKAKGVQ